MTFIAGEGVELRVLQESEEEARIWTRFVMHTNDHLRYVLTGNAPMRWFDIKDEWRTEREKGAVLFGVWLPEVKNKPARFIGTCGLYGPYHLYRRWEARFMIVDAEAVGRGIGLQVTKMLTDYAFDRLNAHKVWLGVNAENLIAYKCYLTAGYRVEGTLREDLFVRGKFVDAIRMAVLEDEWRNAAR